MAVMMVPTKMITKHRKSFVVIFVIVVMFCTFRSNDDDDVTVSIKQTSSVETWPSTTLNESEILRLKEEMSLPKNVIPDIHSLLHVDASYKALTSSDKKCAFPDHINSDDSDYSPNITGSEFLQTERVIFKEHRSKAQRLTRQANVQLRQILDVEKSIDLGNRNNELDAESDQPNRMGMKIDSYLYFPGGHWIPLNCTPKWKVAIIIPYRNRAYNLNVFLRNLVPFLRNQELEFGIFIAEQGPSEAMNRGLMKNIGYQMAQLGGTKWDCYIFHDIDYVPMNITNYYGCDDHPKHYATRLEEYAFGNPYLTDFGGVVGLTAKQFDEINGYSNMYWGWGGEDSDLYKRVKSVELNITKSAEGYYRDLWHKKKTQKERCVHRHCLYDNAVGRMGIDGLSKIRYENSANISFTTLYTQISVDVQQSGWNHNFTKCRLFVGKRSNHLLAIAFIVCYSAIMIVIFACAIFGLALRDMNSEEDDDEKSLSVGKKKGTGEKDTDKLHHYYFDDFRLKVV
ncbi:beta-1,4-galactosyltransferase 5-like [Lytechinus pictus]|uniref:beta-1,4-galactosyltransferase 5-like n=1 Tax=Lytechinus pictus TaxID=7653 RepID=UPI0030BA2341